MFIGDTEMTNGFPIGKTILLEFWTKLFIAHGDDCVTALQGDELRTLSPFLVIDDFIIPSKTQPIEFQGEAKAELVNAGSGKRRTLK